MADVAIVDGTIETALIKAAHTQIKEIATSYKDVMLEVEMITQKVRENWVGVGRNEFESQYNILIRKIEDFGDALQDVYDALVDSESHYMETDESKRQDYIMSMQG